MTTPEKPKILTDIYGKNPPRAAEFGKGAVTPADIKVAPDAFRAQRPGQYRGEPDDSRKARK